MSKQTEREDAQEKEKEERSPPAGGYIDPSIAASETAGCLEAIGGVFHEGAGCVAGLLEVVADFLRWY